MRASLIAGSLGRGRLLTAGVGLVGGLLMAWSLSAQEAPSAPDFPSSRPLPMEEPAGDRPAPLELPPIPPPEQGLEGQGPRIVVKQVLLSGNTVLPRELLAKATEPFMGRELDSDQIERLRFILQGLYIKAGYVNTRVLLPDQDVSQGILHIRIDEGRLESVVIRGEGHFRAGYLEDRLEGLEGEPLNAYALERKLRALEQEPGIQTLRARLRPGTRPGQAILEVSLVENRRFGAALDFGNELNPLIGEMAGHVSVNWLNPVGFGDSATAYFGLSEGLRDLLVRYSSPLNTRGTRLGLDVRFTDAAIVDDELAGFDIDSRYWMAAVDLGQVLWSRGGSQLVVGVRGEWRQSRSTVGGFPYAFTDAADANGEVRDSVLRFYQEWMMSSANQALALRSTWSVGLDVLGATSGDVDTAEFAVWLGQAQWRWRQAESGLEIGFRGSVQLALDPLLPFERYSVGGYYSVRGYRENQMVRDNGYALGLELSVPLLFAASGRSVLRTGPFVDFGRSWNHGRGGDGGQGNLASVGANLSWSPQPWWRFEFSYGAQLIRVVSAGEEGIQDHGVSFRLFAFWP